MGGCQWLSTRCILTRELCSLLRYHPHQCWGTEDTLLLQLILYMRALRHKWGVLTTYTRTWVFHRPSFESDTFLISNAFLVDGTKPTLRQAIYYVCAQADAEDAVGPSPQPARYASRPVTHAQCSAMDVQSKVSCYSIGRYRSRTLEVSYFKDTCCTVQGSQRHDAAQ